MADPEPRPGTPGRLPGTARGGPLELDDGLWLHDTQGRDGVHLLVFRPADRCALVSGAALRVPTGPDADEGQVARGLADLLG